MEIANSESGGREISMIGNLKACFNFYLCVSLCVTFMCVCVGTHRDKKRASDLLEV